MPERLHPLVLDSTVVVHNGGKQAGAEIGYNPKKPGRPSHHPLLVLSSDTHFYLLEVELVESYWCGESDSPYDPAGPARVLESLG